MEEKAGGAEHKDLFSALVDGVNDEEGEGILTTEELRACLPTCCAGARTEVAGQLETSTFSCWQDTKRRPIRSPSSSPSSRSTPSTRKHSSPKLPPALAIANRPTVITALSFVFSLLAPDSR